MRILYILTKICYHKLIYIIAGINPAAIYRKVNRYAKQAMRRKTKYPRAHYGCLHCRHASRFPAFHRPFGICQHHIFQVSFLRYYNTSVACVTTNFLAASAHRAAHKAAILDALRRVHAHMHPFSPLIRPLSRDIYRRRKV